MIGGEKGYKSNESIYKFDFRYNLTKIWSMLMFNTCSWWNTVVVTVESSRIDRRLTNQFGEFTIFLFLDELNLFHADWKLKYNF